MYKEYYYGMSRNFSFAPGEYYHCYSRGVEKRKIFLVKKDYKRFLALLFVANNKEIVHLSNYPEKSFNEILNIKRNSSLIDIGAYCLMPNHFHLLVHEKVEGGLSLFMQKLMTAYTMYFNKKYNRTGSLFESKFKAQHANTDRYLKYLFSYIHLNPAKLVDPGWKEGVFNKKEKIKNFIKKYDYSSYLDYLLNVRSQSVILNRDAFPCYFRNKREFEREILEWFYFSSDNKNNGKVRP